MDIISFNEASTANGRIESFIENPDSTSGVLTVPKTIAAGETITIPAGRVAILPDLQVDGDLVIDGDLFIPTGSMTSQVVQKVTSTDNAVVRFDGVTGQVQNSGVIINDNGNVGIGVTPSAWGSNYKAEQLGLTASVSGKTNGEIILVGTNYYNEGTPKYIVSGNYASLYEQLSGQHRWYTAPSGTAGNPITWTTAMTLDAGGNLIVGQNNTIVTINARYDAGGSQTSIVARGTSNTDSVFQAAIGGVLKSAILANGTYQSATNVYGSTSDVKLKENVVDTSPKLDKLMQVQVRNFNYIGQEDKQIGVVAQEIEQIFPGIVYETKDMEQVEIEQEDGSIKTEIVETGEVTKSVKYSVIYMMMLKGLQEMRAEYTAEINDLKSRIEILEGAK